MKTENEILRADKEIFAKKNKWLNSKLTEQ